MTCKSVGMRHSGRCDNGKTHRSLSSLGQAHEEQTLCGMTSRGLIGGHVGDAFQHTDQVCFPCLMFL